MEIGLIYFVSIFLYLINMEHTYSFVTIVYIIQSAMRYICIEEIELL